MWVFFSLALIIILLLFSSLKLEISEALISSLENIKNISFKISLHLFSCFKIFSIKIYPNKFSKNVKIDYKKIFKILNFIQEKQIIKIEKFIFSLEVGTQNPIISSYIIAIFSSILSYILARYIPKYNKTKYNYHLTPLYINKNTFNLSINCITSIKLVHIIYMIYVLRKDDDKNGRASNRRSYDNCYE